MRTIFITWTALAMMVGGTLKAQELNLKTEAADNFITLAALGAAATAGAAALATGALTAMGAGAVNLLGNLATKILAKGVEPEAATKELATDILKEAATEVLNDPAQASAVAANNMNDSLSLDYAATDLMITRDMSDMNLENDPVGREFIKIGVPHHKVREIIKRAKEKMARANEILASHK